VITFGSGNATVFLGAGSDLCNVVAGEGGGRDIVFGFDPGHGMLRLAGFGAGGARALATQTTEGGGTTLTLPDGTHLLFADLATLRPANVVFA
jgi:hypothetical protein